MLYEQGTPDVGLASAGQGARAQDASTVFTNPAGMTQLQGSQLLVGVELLFGNYTFSPNAKTSLKGTNGGNAAVPMPGGSFFFGRYRLQGATMLGMSFRPSIAFRAADWLSIGGGPNVMMGFLRAKAGINTLNPRLGDGQVRYQNYTVNVGGNWTVLSLGSCKSPTLRCATPSRFLASSPGDAEHSPIPPVLIQSTTINGKPAS